MLQMPPVRWFEDHRPQVCRKLRHIANHKVRHVRELYFHNWMTAGASSCAKSDSTKVPLTSRVHGEWLFPTPNNWPIMQFTIDNFGWRGFWQPEIAALASGFTVDRLTHWNICLHCRYTDVLFLYLMRYVNRSSESEKNVSRAFFWLWCQMSAHPEKSSFRAVRSFALSLAHRSQPS